MSGVEIDWKVLIGQIVNFSILFFVLKFFVYRPFLDLLKKRRERIEEGINKSIEAEKKLSKLDEVKKRMEEKNEEDRRKILAKSEEEAKKRAEESMRKTEAEKDALLAKARKEAEDLKEKEKEETKKETIENAFSLTEKILKESIDEKKGRQIAEDFLKKLKV